MGREIKRVALDYNFAIGETWQGFINNHYRKCPHCSNGYTTARARLGDLVSLLMLSGEDARRQKAHPYFYDAPFHNTAGRIVPSADMVALTVGLAGRAMGGFGHDCCDRYTAEKKIIAAAGLPEKWGICSHCDGEAVDPACKAAHEAWTETPPPAGDGYQLWETTSEGSPLTPVFDTPEKLARYCADQGVSSFGRDTCDYDTWLKFIRGPGWAPSMVFSNKGMQSGVAASSE
jgi:hypothetical protein